MTSPSQASLPDQLRIPGSRRGRILEFLSVMWPPGVRMAGAGVQFLTTIAIARLLGDEKSAGFFFWSAILTSSVPVATYGLEQLALRNTPRLEKEGCEAVSRFLGSLRFFSFFLSLLIGCGLVAYAAGAVHPEGRIVWWHGLLPFALASMALCLINGEALKGLSRPVLGMVFGHFVPVSLFCLFTLALAGRGESPGLLAAYAAAYGLGAIAVSFVPVPEMRRPFAPLERDRFRDVIREGFPVSCVNVFGALCYIVPLAYLESTRPAPEVAYVTTALRITILFAILSTAIHGVFAPQLSRAAELPEPARPLFRVYGKSILLSLAALAPPLLFGICFPGLVMSVFGESFREGAPMLRLLLAGQLVFLAMGPVPHLLLMTGNTPLMARLGIGKLLVTVTLTLLLVPSFGGVGMVCAMSVAFFCEEAFGLTYVILQLRKGGASTA